MRLPELCNPRFSIRDNQILGPARDQPWEQLLDCRAPSGIITRGPDAAAIRGQREEESALSSPWSSGQEIVMGSGEVIIQPYTHVLQRGSAQRRRLELP